MKTTIMGIVLLLSQGVLANSVEVRGADLSFSHPDYREKVVKIWDFVSNSLVRGDSRPIAAPVVYFESFAKGEQSAELTEFQTDWVVQSPEVWLEWVSLQGIAPQQVTEEWIRANLDKLNVIQPGWRGIHYVGSNRIQINPETTFMAFYQNDPSGFKRDMVGYGYYVTGHEMTHHALAERGVPEKLHHCIYVVRTDGREALMERLANHLVETGVSGAMVSYYGVAQEMQLDPCAQLSEKDRARAFAYARQLEQPILTALARRRP